MDKKSKSKSISLKDILEKNIKGSNPLKEREDLKVSLNDLLSLENKDEPIKSSMDNIMNIAHRVSSLECADDKNLENKQVTNGKQLDNKQITEKIQLDNKRVTKQVTNGKQLDNNWITSASSSSSSIITTTTEPLEDLRSIAEKISATRLEKIGFTKTHLIQILQSNKFKNLEMLQESIDHISFYLTTEKAKQKKTNFRHRQLNGR